MRINKLLKYRATFIEKSNNNLLVYKSRNINDIY